MSTAHAKPSTRRRDPPASFVERVVPEPADADAALERLLDLILDTEEGRALLESARRRARK